MAKGVGRDVNSGMPGAGEPAGTGTLAPNVAAGLAYLFGFVGGILFLVLERRNRDVRFAALQSILLCAASVAVWMAYSLAFAVLGLVPILRLVAFALAAPVGVLVGAVFFVAWLVSVLRSFQGTTPRLPLLCALADRLLAAV